MDQITITRKDFRERALSCTRGHVMDAVGELKTESVIVLALYGTIVVAEIEKELFGKETEEE